MNCVRKELLFGISKFIILLFMTVSLEATHSRADEVYTFVIKKQEEKAKTRWSLSDWLSTRDKMRMQDLWLALHSPSPFEFYLGGNYQLNQTGAGSRFSAWEAYFGAFASIFGLEARYESALERRLHAIFNLRVFGFHDQSTNITFQLGLRETNNGSTSYRNALGGIRMAVYFARVFGIGGLYRYYFPSTSSDSGVSHFGHRFQGGAFLEFNFLRIYGDYFSELESVSNSSGIILGTRFYF